MAENIASNKTFFLVRTMKQKSNKTLKSLSATGKNGDMKLRNTSQTQIFANKKPNAETSKYSSDIFTKKLNAIYEE
jgi:hypothetical protein